MTLRAATHSTPGRDRSGALPFLLSAFCFLLFPAPLHGQAQAGAVITTNYVVVTNLVVITNYVVVTNLVLGTNLFEASPTTSRLPDLSWVPPEDGYDWIQLKSGEWLKGEIKAMQKRRLEFDSEELELLSFDWKDIRQLRSPHVHDLLFAHREQASGPVVITPERVIVGDTNPQTFARSDLQSITPGGPKERDLWSGKLVMGLTLRSGTTRELDYNAQAHLERRTPGTRLALDYVGSISTINDVQNANNQRANAEFDYWLTRRLYLITPFAEFYSDPFQNIAERLSGGVGVGYDVVVTPTVEWNVWGGPAYQHVWFSSVEAGQPATSGEFAFALGTHFKWDLTRRTKLILDYSAQRTTEHVAQSSQHASATLELDFTKRFELDVSFFWDHTQRPETESNGTAPPPSDLRLVIGLGVRF